MNLCIFFIPVFGARCDKLSKMCRVLGIDPVHDPDETYELTADNVKKMLAIYMRFRFDSVLVFHGMM